MRKSFLIATLAIVATMPLLTSCAESAKRLAKEVKENIKDKENMPRYLRNSEKWGAVLTVDLGLSDFMGINAEGFVDVVYVQADDFKVTLEGNEKVIDEYKFFVEDEELNIELKKKQLKERIPTMRLTVQAPTIECINVSGTGDIYMKEAVSLPNDLRLDISGAGDVDIYSLVCEQFDVNISGAGDLDIYEIDCTAFSIDVSGAGDTKIKKGTAEGDASFNISGVGDISAKFDCKDLHVTVSGAGEADIKTDCQTAYASANGTGEIEIEGRAHKLVRNQGGLAKVITKKLLVEELER